MADHPLAVRAADIETAARNLAAALGVPAGTPAEISDASKTWFAACARDLQANRGASIVIAGESQPPYVHALAHMMNHALANAGTTVTYSDPVVANAENQTTSLRELCRDMDTRGVDTLVIIGGNPVYCAPSDLDFKARLSKVPFVARMGLYERRNIRSLPLAPSGNTLSGGLVRRTRVRRDRNHNATANRSALRR